MLFPTDTDYQFLFFNLFCIFKILFHFTLYISGMLRRKENIFQEKIL